MTQKDYITANSKDEISYVTNWYCGNGD